MSDLIVLGGIALGLLLVSALLRRALPHLLAGAIGRRVAARQADQITMTPAGDDAWQEPETPRAMTFSLTALGFADAGTYRIPELPGAVVRLMVNERESFSACVYEHPVAGHWLDVVTRHIDGTASCFSTARPTGLDGRPGFQRVNAPGATVPELVARARAERPVVARRPATAALAAAEFAAAWASEVAWRKQRGISAREVAEVARNRPHRHAA